MSPVLNQIQEKVYERPIPYSPILGHSGSNRELLINVYCQYLEKRSQDILRRKPDKGYSGAGSIVKYTTWGSCLTGGLPA